ncbi:hypothetical protein SKAU_G00159300 [Synaphobranchus kaupii]|uniref:Beta-lactamase-related domain-containing protein n=1 Tax=Synaphobranchus kaupii TaxID=118154 RepID=A0A9Q1FIR9_SYNKA|nr:hypothetical protein SKAU_G00159300 [Synaphobranchus kaupii]
MDNTRCHYSNLAFSLLAHVLAEKVVGLDYQHWISDSILDRLGMEDTGFDITPGIQSQMAVGVYTSGQPAALRPGLVPALWADVLHGS